MTRVKNVHISYLILSFGFVLVIFLSFFDQVLNWSTPNIAAENRRLASKPKLDIERLDYFPKEYDAYFNDHFGFRNDLIIFNSGFRLNVLGISPFEKVAKGKEGWLFSAKEYLVDYRAKQLFTNSDLEKIAKALEYRKDWCNKQDIKFYLAVAPGKPSIYEEYLPSFLRRVHGISRYEQLKNYLSENSTFELIDLQNSMITNKTNDLLYYKTDPHWNSMGGFFAYQEILNTIQMDFPQLSILKLDDYSLSYDSIPGRNLARMLNMPEEYPDIEVMLSPKFETKATWGKKENYIIPEDFYYKKEYEIVKYVPGSNQPKIMIIRDSFINALIPYIDETFSRTVYIWDNWKYQLNKPIVENEKPDVLLILLVEKNLINLLENIDNIEINYKANETRK